MEVDQDVQFQSMAHPFKNRPGVVGKYFRVVLDCLGLIGQSFGHCLGRRVQGSFVGRSGIVQK